MSERLITEALQTLINATRAYVLEDVRQLIAGTIAGGKLQLSKGSGTLPTTTLPASVIQTTTALGGDLAGNLPNPTVAKIDGSPVVISGPSANQVLAWNGTDWVNAADPGGPPSGAASGDLSGTYPDPTVAKIDGSPVLISGAMTGQVLRWNGTDWVNANIVVSVNFVIDGGGSALTTGVKGYVIVDFAATITRVSMLADQSGSVQVDVWRCTYAQFDAGTTHPVVGDSITASDTPTITSATKMQDSTLTGWTTTINAGDVLAFDVVSAATIQRVTIDLKLTRA